MKYRAYLDYGRRQIVIRTGVWTRVTALDWPRKIRPRQTLLDAGWIMQGGMSTDDNGESCYHITPRPKGRS